MGRATARAANERRQKLWILMLKGHSQPFIVKELNVCNATWDKFNDPKVPEKQKVSYLRLTREYHSAMIELIANGPTVMAIQDLTRRADRLGIRFDAADIGNGNDSNNNSDESSELS